MATKEQLLKRREELVQKKQALMSSSTDNVTPKKRTVGEKITSALPTTGQVVGGVGGSILGTLIGKPFAGGVAGGTLGRAGGVVQRDLINNFKKNPAETAKNLFLNSLTKGPVVGSIASLTGAQKKELGREFLKTAGIETVTGGLFKGASAGGQGVLKALLGPRVAERGLKVGFKQLLDPKFFQNRVAKDIAFKANKFFGKLNNVAGKAVEKSIKKASAIFHSTDDIVAKGAEALKREGAESLDDLVTANVSKAQLKKAKQVESMFKSLGNSDKISTFELWKKRREMDDVFFNTRWEQGIERYLKNLRIASNEPIKSSSEDIAKSFGRYQFVKESEESLGKKFSATLVDDEVFTPQTEQFVSNLLGTSKDETVRQLKKLDTFLGAEDRIVEDLLDTAAAETFDKNIELMGLFSRGLIGSVGGRKAIAGVGAAGQTPIVRGLATAGQRGVIGGLTEAANQPSQQ